MLKPRNRLDLSASGAFDASVVASWLDSEDVLFVGVAPNKLNPGLLAGGCDGFARDVNMFDLGVSDAVPVLCSGLLILLNRFGLGADATSSGSLIAAKGLLEVGKAVSCALEVCCPKLKGVEAVVVAGNDANELLAGADAGVLDVPKKFVDGAMDVALLLLCALAPKLKRLGVGAVAVEPPWFCELVPMLKRLGLGVSCSVFCELDPKPGKRLLGAGAALFCVEVPNPLKMLLGAGVLEVFWGAEDVAPKLKGVGAGAGVPDAFGVELVAPNMFDEGALLLVPNMPPVDAALVVFCDMPPNGLLDCCPPKPPNAGAGPLPLVMGEDEEKGLLAPAVKLKLVAGGCGLKPVLWLPAPNAGNEEFANELLGADDWAGGKLLVAPPPPNALLPPKPRPFVLLLFVADAGAVAPKLMPPNDAPKFALCEGVCVCALA